MKVADVGELNMDRVDLTEPDRRLIATFMRFEFALKEAGFCPQDGNALVEWGRVTKELGSTFYENVKQSGRAETLMSNPPKKQVSRERRLGWEDQDAPANVHELFEAVRRVRNNLLHGGKSGDTESGLSPASRKKALVSEAQWAVEQALHQMGKVKNYFEGRY